ncbi:ABC transporter substrate-binding protein [Arcanobacterium hippocoleae]|uniref:Peptide/nickel transport system substrate-binding protein n=1 Tax=Arcanobacterium hippocoleae TaxID=149017 RepID=A0ABU1T366_9ACTO|nr:ABC transporter substrate-binding protein [Arcanobacterium hippocoleae]MDR6939748.1 peptide/nickel transport system substrate-binding protein [Arcanobacterium hippocoleae]
MRSFKRWAKGAAVVAAAALALSACGGGAADKGSDAKPEAGGGPKGSISLGAAYETTNYHPSTTSSALAMGTNWHVVEGLYEFDMADYSVYAALAKDEPKKISDTEYEITLRDGAKFSDGSEVKAEDVAASYARTAKKGNIYAQFFDFVDSVTAKDEHTVSLKLKYPFGNLKERLVDVKIVPAKATDEDLTKMPVGTGPFKYDSITQTEIKMSANPHYNGKFPAKVETMNWQAIKDDNARLTAALGGTIDVMETVPFQFIDQLKGAGWKIDEVPGYNNPFIMFNTTKAPFDKPEVRQAFHYAIDTQTLIDSVMGGKAIKATSFLPEANAAYKKAATQYEFNTEKAKELLAKGGAAGATFTLLTTDHPWITQLVPQIKQNLEAAGLKVNVQSVASAAVYEQTDKEGAADFDVVLAPGDPSVFGSDPGIIINWWYGDNVWTKKRGALQVSDPEGFKTISEKITEASKLPAAEAKAKWGEVQDIIAEKAVIYPLFHRTMITGWNPAKLDGVKSIATTGLELVGVAAK